VTANLTRGTADTHATGPLMRLVLASNSVPGLAPPVYYEGDVHVDGGVMDNLPVAALRALGAGRVIAIDVGTEVRVSAPAQLADCPSGWGLLWDRVARRPTRSLPVFVSLSRALTLASDDRVLAACRDADLVLRPPLGDYASTDFSDIDAIAELGFLHASQQLEGWAAR
jgi:NTE family protein